MFIFLKPSYLFSSEFASVRNTRAKTITPLINESTTVLLINLKYEDLLLFFVLNDTLWYIYYIEVFCWSHTTSTLKTFPWVWLFSSWLIKKIISRFIDGDNNYWLQIKKKKNTVHEYAVQLFKWVILNLPNRVWCSIECYDLSGSTSRSVNCSSIRTQTVRLWAKCKISPDV